MLAADIEGLTGEQWSAPSMCEGWTVGEVVNHMMVADRIPSSLGWGGSLWALPGSIRGWPPATVIRWQREAAGRGPEDAAMRLRTNKLPLTVRFFGRFGSSANFVEEAVHSEDVRRPLGLVRADNTPADLAWAALRRLIPFQFRKLRARGILSLIDRDGTGFTVRSRRPWPRVSDLEDHAGAVVTGDPLELMMYSVGRPSDVAVQGDGPLADAARTRRMSL